jgi:hypothetical protein
MVAACGARTPLEGAAEDAGIVSESRARFDGATGPDAGPSPDDAAPFDAPRFDAAPSEPGPAMCTPPDAGAGGGVCFYPLVVTSLERSAPSCFVDVVIAVGQHGVLSFPCQGDGPAKIIFDSRQFSGADIAGTIDVCTGTEFPWGDGCTWTGAQRVTGTLAASTLTFSYAEGPKPGQTGCASPCTAGGTIAIQ